MSRKIRVTVWNEYRHEKQDEAVGKVYPEGIHNAIANYLKGAGFDAGTATLDEPEHGLTDEVLNATDVLIWWGHMAHQEVRDDIVEKVYRRVLKGMGLIVLHSGHASKIFRKLCGTESWSLKWREADERERLWVIEPGHPIVEGLERDYIELEHEETYGERFDIPAPDTLVFIGWFQGGEVFRSGCCFNRGSGKIFYFQPGHETYPIYYHPEIQKVIGNAVRWAAPVNGAAPVYGQIVKSLEKI